MATDSNLMNVLARMDAAAKANNHQLAAALAEKARRISPDYNPASFDDLSDKGAPITTRMLVGASEGEDRLTNLRRHFPEAMPVGDDNYAFFDREEGRPTIYNPEGFFRMDTITGDLAENSGMIPAVFGGAASAAVTSPTAPTGAPLVAAGVGATAAENLYEAGVRKALGGTDTRDLGEYAEDVVGELVMNTLPIPEAAKKAFDKVSPTVSSWFANTSKAVHDVVNKYGIDTTAGVVGNKMVGLLDAYHQKSLATVDLWQKRYDEMLEGFGDMVNNFHTSLGGRRTATTAGIQLLEKAKNYQSQFIDTSNALQKELDDLIPEGTMLNAENTMSYLAQYRDAFKNDPAFQKLVQNAYPALLGDAFEEQGGQISYHALSALRTRIGGLIKSNDTIGDVTQGELKQMYKAMTEDKFNAANGMGDVVGDLAKKFNDHYRTGMEIQETFVQPYMMTNGNWVDPAEVTRRVGGLMQKPETAKSLKNSGLLDEGDFNAVTSAVFDDIAVAAPSAQNAAGDRLSPSRVLSQSNKVSDEAAETFLNQDSKAILADMRAFAEGVADVERNVNRSNSGVFVQAGEALGATGVAATSLLQGDIMPALKAGGALFVNYLSAKGLQSDAFTRWVRQAPKEGNEKAKAEWYKAGRRIAVNQNIANVYDAWLDGFADFSKTDITGALEE